MNYKEIARYIDQAASAATTVVTLGNALDLIGLQRRRSAASYVLPTLGIFVGGIAVGAGLGLLFAPQPGARLRDGLTKKVNDTAERLRITANNGSTPGELGTRTTTSEYASAKA